MLDHEPDTNEPNESNTLFDDAAPAEPVAKPTRRRRAASRPAGPPTPAPTLDLGETTDRPAEAQPTDTPQAETHQAAGSAAEPAGAETPPPAKRARKTTTRRTTKKAAAPPASEGPASEASATEASATGEEQPAEPAPATKPRKTTSRRTAKKAATASKSTATPKSTTPKATTTAEPEADDEPEAEAKPVRKRASRKRAAAAEPQATDTQPAEIQPAEIQSEVAAAAPTTPVADTAVGSAESPVAETSVPETSVTEQDQADSAQDQADSAETTGAEATETTESESESAEADVDTAAEAGADSAEPAAEDSDPDPIAEAVAALLSQAEAGETESTDTDTDAEGEGQDDTQEGHRRRRRRRGGRRRRRGGGSGDESDSAGESDSADAQSADAAPAEGKPADSKSADGKSSDGKPADTDESADGDSDGEGEGSRRRRRRRRRRGEDSGDDSGSRSRRDSKSEVTGIDGSTRMEAKRQRRREGREAGRRRAPILSEAEFLSRRESVTRKMVIRQREDLTQIAVLEDDILVEHYVDRESAASLIGNVYLGRVQNVLPSMEAAFIDIGRGRNAVLYAGEVDWDSYGVTGEDRKVEKVLKSGQTILVQVSKDPVGAKGARLTNHITIPGRYIVYAPGGHLSGISRKLPDTERKRLKDILTGLVPEDASVVVRTAAEGASEEELVRDVNRLKAQWEDIERKVKSGSAPQLLYGEPDLTVRIVRDLFTEDFAELIVQGNGGSSDAYDVIEAYVAHVAPHLADRLKRYEGGEGKDLFAEYRLDEQIAKALERKVFLPSGGSLIIDRTEAMTVIDVNTGKFTGSGGNLEATVTKNNLEAAEEIVRQLRLRDIGGIIVIDFIDMVLPSNRELLLRRLVECLGRDRTRHQVAEVTSLGLVQMTRKRIGTGLLEAFSTPCPHCNGRGVELHDVPVETQQQPDGGAREQKGRGGRGRSRSRGGSSGGGNQNGTQAEPKSDAKSDSSESKSESKAKTESKAESKAEVKVEQPV